MENYMQYHVMGSVSQVRMKPGCLPKKFECQSSVLSNILIKYTDKDSKRRSTVTENMELGESSFESSGTNLFYMAY